MKKNPKRDELVCTYKPTRVVVGYFIFFFFYYSRSKQKTSRIPTSGHNTELSCYTLICPSLFPPPPLFVVTIPHVIAIDFDSRDTGGGIAAPTPPHEVKLSLLPRSTSHFRVIADSTLINDILIDEIFNRERDERGII